MWKRQPASIESRSREALAVPGAGFALGALVVLAAAGAPDGRAQASRVTDATEMDSAESGAKHATR